MKLYTNSFYANIYLNAAEELGYDIEILDKLFGVAVIKNKGKEIVIYKNTISINNAAGTRILKNKYTTTSILSGISDIGPAQKIFDLANYKNQEQQVNENIITYVKSKDFKVVIKALDLSLGKGIFILPRNIDEVLKAINSIHYGYIQRYILVEDYFEAKEEYRIIVIGGKIIDILKRVPAYIIGDGRKTVVQLVDEKNELRAKYGFGRIKLDENSLKLLGLKNINTDSIISDGEEIQLKEVCNLAQGGESLRVGVDELNKEYSKIFEEISKISRLNLIGIDLMVKGVLSENPNKSNAMINEVNSSPSPDVSFFADVNEGHLFIGVKKILESFFKIK